MLNILRWRRPTKSAISAKDRLQILLSHERNGPSTTDYLPLLQRDILEAVKRHLGIGGDQVDIHLERGDDLSTLEINIELPGDRIIEARAAS